jgi:site-specific DNA-methyltransferase (adenine-specific)
MIKPYYSEPNITIYNGDCLEVMKELPDNSIDCVITDPPYGINYLSNMRVKSEKFELLVNDDSNFRFKLYELMFFKMKINSAALIFCSFKNYPEDYNELKKYFDIKNIVVWFKPGGGIGDLEHSLSTDYELVVVAHKGKCTIKSKRIGSVWKINKVNPNSMVHPTQKPAPLINELLKCFTSIDDTILDPFLGSGTTARACKDLGRKCIGIEINKKYCDIAIKRLAQEVFNFK